MAAISAAILMVAAITSSATMAIRKGRGVCSRRLAATPLPVTRPILALTSWMAIMNGNAKNTVQPSPVPNCAPACV